MTEQGTAAVAASVVAAALGGLWLGSGVSVSELASFVGYELLLAGLPGILVYRALCSQPGGILRHVAIGWPTGYAIEVGAFALTAALSLRWAFPILPLAAAAIAAGVLWRRRKEGMESASAEAKPNIRLPPAAIWAVAAVIALALGYLALGYFTLTPLPRDAVSVSYPGDAMFHLGVITEAQERWPIEYPSVSGTPLHYHLYGFIQMAATSQATGIEPSTVLFRLFPATLIMIVALQVVALGRELGRSPWLGPLAAALVLLVGELDLDPNRPAVFTDAFFPNLPLSPTFLFGIPLFLAITTLLLGAVSGQARLRLGDWFLLGILLLACAGAKASTVPVIVGGLVLWQGWSWLRGRGIFRPALISIGIATATYAITYALLYAGGGSASFGFEIFAFTDFSVFNELVPPATRSQFGDVVLTAATGLLAAAAVVLPTLGILWVLRSRRLALEPGEAWLLAVFLVALGAFLVLGHPGESQLYFLDYGYIAGCVLSARGILLFLESSKAAWDRPGAVLGALVAAVLAAGTIAVLVLDVPGGAGLGRIALAYGIAALAIAVLALWAGRSSGGRLAGTATGVALLLAISLGLINTPLDYGVPAVSKLRADETLYPPDDPNGPRGVTTELLQGLRWIRDHTGEDEVVAVNNHAMEPTGLDSRYFYYTAFAERRAFLESWLYSEEANELGYERVARGEVLPFPDRRRLNAAVFELASPQALEQLERTYGVDYLLVDKLHGEVSPRLRRIGPPVFENDAVAIYELSGEVG